MLTKTRVLVNTIVLYAKAVLTTLIALISVPIILKALGQSDYGLYNLIAGVIAMLSFINASMTVSIQRFMSVSMGEGDLIKINYIYNTGLFLHFLIGIILIILFEAFAPLVFSGFLNIESDRLFAAQIVYQVLIISTFFTILSIPFNAALNAHEDLIIFAVIHIAESILRLLLAVGLIYCPIDRLITYAIGIACITLIVFLAKLIYVKYRYKYLVIQPRTSVDRVLFKKMIGFAGWNTFGSLALIGRNQGLAMIMNVFYGTIINAAYGIANQINGLMSYLSTTFQQAINPQLMKSEGMHDRNRLIRISYVSSKFSVLVICFPALPLIIEMSYVLSLWLKDVPNHTIPFSQLILTLTIITQYSSGLQSAIQSVGKIRPYYISISTLLLLNIPIAYFILKSHCPPYYTLICFVIIELITLIVRLVFARKYAGISIREFIKKVIYPTSLTMLVATIPTILVHYWLPQSFSRLIITCAIYAIVYALIAWRFALERSEKEFFASIVPFLKRFV